jgi:hypothetical protein
MEERKKGSLTEAGVFRILRDKGLLVEAKDSRIPWDGELLIEAKAAWILHDRDVLNWRGKLARRLQYFLKENAGVKISYRMAVQALGSVFGLDQYLRKAIIDRLHEAKKSSN